MRTAGHVFTLVAVTAALTLPNLGTPSLWDVDEGVNAGCTAEMLDAGTWIVPTFNGDLRTAKPVMLYWLQRFSYLTFGVGEFGARLPAALLAIGTVLLVYDLGRKMFDPATGLLAGVVLASCVEFCKLSHAATPDAPLIFFTTLTFRLFWVNQLHGSRAWFVPTAAACGLAVLTKGPVGVALPALVGVVLFAWNRELKRFLDRRLIHATVVFLLVAAPWYGLVISETRGAYLAFFRDENANRFLTPMEGHRGPVVYYLGALLAFFAPWSAFLGGAVWYGVKEARGESSTRVVTGEIEGLGGLGARLLLVWVSVYLIFFSVAATKLPNYIGPVYPAAALLTARFLTRWTRHDIMPAKWVMPTAAAAIMLVGVVLCLGLLVAGGTVQLPAKGLRIMPELAPWAAFGLVPIATGLAFWFSLSNRGRAVTFAAAGAVLFVGVLAAFAPCIVDRYKAPKTLVLESGAGATDREIRLASLDYTQPSVTFYAGRRVERMKTVAEAEKFLQQPHEAYLFVPKKVLDEQWPASARYRVAAGRFDFYRSGEIVVLTNH